ncbi:hypothetical protein C8J57DRAFT_1247413 [Mycena rebaudengoi]|nr:hypothetical protein C8J57DRAFT_1247413 [Mycena rebaudengoi]
MRPEHIEIFFQLPPGSAHLALRALHSLFYLPPMYTRFSVPDDATHDGQGDDFLHCALRLLSSPRNTEDTKNFHKNIVGGLPKLLSRVAPSDTLISLLRDEQVQNTIFSRFEDSESWPKGSGYPRDLIQLWENHRFIAELVGSPLTTNQAPPTYNFDTTYREILSGNPDLLFLLRLKIIKPDLTVVLVFLSPQYNRRVFQPFLKFREPLRLCSNLGDLPVKFLGDRHRARNLYLAPQHAFEDLVLLWIRHARKCLVGADVRFPDPPLQAIAFWERQRVMINQMIRVDISFQFAICGFLARSQIFGNLSPCNCADAKCAGSAHCIYAFQSSLDVVGCVGVMVVLGYTMSAGKK